MTKEITPHRDYLEELEALITEQNKLMGQLYESSKYIHEHQYDAIEDHETRLQKELTRVRIRLLLGNQYYFNKKLLELLKAK